MSSRSLFLVFHVSHISTTPVPNHIWYGQCIVGLLCMCTVVDTSSLLGIHSSRLVLVTSRIPRYYPHLASRILHPIPITYHPQSHHRPISFSIFASSPPISMAHQFVSPPD
ncbi:hypothetical protein K466DRAFT_19959 [Polyporus arcularius HHB13444]|uniref:Uncharacterized protein n=1 Tax=Polyporus arcularius HHB13444 TaxID=1314778 RepID=A0A5C3PKI2_9APHY|nr:hypothetical protein K466DRAFT_19959 [Polyporus arcularius HHB13444]